MKRVLYCVLACLTLMFTSNLQAQSGGNTATQQSVACDTYMDAGPLTRATSFGEEQVVTGVYQGLAQQYNSIAGQLKSVVFWGRVNPASASGSNTVKVIVYNANQGLPGTIIGSQNVVVNAANASYMVTATFAAPLSVNGNIIISIEPFSPLTDNFFVQRNASPDGQFLNLTKIKQANQWFKNLAAGDPAFDYDFMILPVKAINLTANFTANTVANVTTFTNSSSNATSYEWNFGDGGTSTATSPVHNYTASGTYNVKLKAFSSGITTCADSIIIPVSVVITGLNELHDGRGWLQLKHNLVNDELVVTLQKQNEIIISDVHGASVGSFKFRSNETRVIDISAYLPGIYYVSSPNQPAVKFVKVN